MLQCSMSQIIELTFSRTSVFFAASQHRCKNTASETAYTTRHNGGVNAFYSDHFVLPLPDGHRFPMEKYALLRQAVVAHCDGVALMQAPAATDGELALVHSPDYIASIMSGSATPAMMREIGFPWSAFMAERARRSVGATIAAVQVAMHSGLGGNLAGGTHHAYADKGGGFCVFNDVAVAARLAQAQWARQHRQPLLVAVIDLDVHQGNGTADVFRHDRSVFTLSLHGEKNFPFRKEASDLDVALPDGCGDDAYLAALDHALADMQNRFDPGLVIYLAGADPHEGDRLGRLKLSADGLEARDRRVFAWCSERQVPVAFVMAGGYGVNIDNTVALQLTTFKVAYSFWRIWQQRQASGSATP